MAREKKNKDTNGEAEAPEKKGAPEATKKKEALPGKGETFSISSAEDASEALKSTFKNAKLADSDAAADFVVSRLTPEGREIMLRTLVAKEAERRSIKPDDLARMNDLDPAMADGAYPYRNPYIKDLYDQEVYQLQIELLKLQKWVKEQGKKIVVIFEGRDAAGKAETISVFTKHLNPRGARIVALSKPTEEEKGQWYFQRYTRTLPTKGEIVFYDRSWYNRAVVEPVMGFCTQEESEQFLKEVPFVEKSIVDSGVVLIKFWLSVSQKEQRRRFKAREMQPLKRWKLTPVDIASMPLWDEYTKASAKMFFVTDTPDAPWTIVRSDDLMRARLNAMRVVLHSMDYEGKDPEIIGKIDPLIVGRASTFYAHSQAVGYSVGAFESAVKKTAKKVID